MNTPEDNKPSPDSEPSISQSGSGGASVGGNNSGVITTGAGNTINIYNNYGETGNAQAPNAPTGGRDSATISKRKLLQEIEQRMGLNDLKEACFDLGIDYDNLEGGTKTTKSMALINYCQRRGMIDQLLASLTRINGAGNWDVFD